MRQAITLTIIAFAGDPAIAHSARKVDPKADELLRRMSVELARMTRFSFDADHMLEVMTRDGQKLQFVAQSHVSVQRPDQVRSDPVGPHAVDFARDDLGLEAPAADLLSTNAYAGLMADVITGTYIGNEPIGDRMCHHLAYHGRKADWQIWIEDGPHALPCRYVITTTDELGQPEFAISMSHWSRR